MPSRRSVILVAAAGAATMALAACQKPVPELTVLSGSTTVRVSPQTYCFDTTHCRFPNTKPPTITAREGDTLLVDVPRAVAHGVWRVTSQRRSGTTFTPIPGAPYYSPVVRNSHSTTVQVPYGTGDYYLVVQQVGSTQGTWIAQVSITS